MIGQQARRQARQAIGQYSLEMRIEQGQRIGPAALRGEDMRAQQRHQ